MSYQMNLWGSHNATSSPGSAYGATPCAEQDGATTGQFGLDLAHASLSARQAQGLGLMTSGTSGHIGTGSSSSANLQSSLESRLRARTASAGSILYRLTWKHRVTPSGRAICALRASAARISVSDFILSGWPTASSRDWKDTPGMATTATNPDGSTRTRLDQLPRVAGMAGWPTPSATNADKSVRTQAGAEAEAVRKGWTNDLATAAMSVAGWPTPMAGTPARNGNSEAGNTDYSRKASFLCGAEVAGANVTPVENWSGPMRLCSDGTLLTGSSAGMESGGRLHPAHSRWLMRLPREWDDCAPTETRSMRKPRQASSKP